MQKVLSHFSRYNVSQVNSRKVKFNCAELDKSDLQFLARLDDNLEVKVKRSGAGLLVIVHESTES